MCGCVHVFVCARVGVVVTKVSNFSNGGRARANKNGSKTNKQHGTHALRCVWRMCVCAAVHVQPPPHPNNNCVGVWPIHLAHIWRRWGRGPRPCRRPRGGKAPVVMSPEYMVLILTQTSQRPPPPTPLLGRLGGTQNTLPGCAPVRRRPPPGRSSAVVGVGMGVRRQAHGEGVWWGHPESIRNAPLAARAAQPEAVVVEVA